MRVIDTRTGEFAEIDPEQEARYAILSHTWDHEGEQTYDQLRAIQTRHISPDDNSKEPLAPIFSDDNLSSKIREACRVARENGYDYIWVDSCCIDKSSSSELSESINSMFQWYLHAKVCYAFLADVPAEEDPRAENSSFRKSRWFTRAWTLQELIAPLTVIFFTKDWTKIGSKASLVDLVADITQIDDDALLHIEQLNAFSVAQRFSWAARREATREEDRAYSLLGLLDINMPTLYGEGDRAFRRLQEEIMRRTPDQSLFVWSISQEPSLLVDPSPDLHDPKAVKRKEDQGRFVLSDHSSHTSLLAPSLDCFSGCGDIKMVSHDDVLRRLQLTADRIPVIDYHFTPYGIRVQLPAINFSSSNYFPPGSVHSNSKDIPFSQYYLVILGCEYQHLPGRLLGRICYIQLPGSSVDIIYCGLIVDQDQANVPSGILPVSYETITRFFSSHISLKTLYIHQSFRTNTTRKTIYERYQRHNNITIILRKKTTKALSAQGYTATLYRGDLESSHDEVGMLFPYSILLVHDTHTITIGYECRLYNIPSLYIAADQSLKIDACVRTSQTTQHPYSLPDIDTKVSWEETHPPGPWTPSLKVHTIDLNTYQGPLTLSLGLTLVEINCYLVEIKLKTPLHPHAIARPADPESDILETLPGSVGTLETQVDRTHLHPHSIVPPSEPESDTPGACPGPRAPETTQSLQCSPPAEPEHQLSWKIWGQGKDTGVPGGSGGREGNCPMLELRSEMSITVKASFSAKHLVITVSLCVCILTALTTWILLC